MIIEKTAEISQQLRNIERAGNMTARFDPPAVYNALKNHKPRPSNASDISSISSNTNLSNLQGRNRTAGLLSDVSRRTLESHRARICSSWNIASVEEAFPPDIRPQKPLAMSAINHLKHISSAVSLDVARRLFREECEITKVKGQESERTVVGYSHCRNVDKRINEGDIDATISASDSAASDGGSLLPSSMHLNPGARLNTSQTKGSEANTKKSKIITFKVSSANLQALSTSGFIRNGIEKSIHDSQSIPNLPLNRKAPETLEKPPHKKQKQEGRSRSASITSTQVSRDISLQTILENQRRNAELAEQIFGPKAPALPRTEGNRALVTTSRSPTPSDTIVVDCGPLVTPVAVVPAVLHASVSAPVSPSVTHEDEATVLHEDEDGDKNKNAAEDTHISPIAASLSPSAEPSCFAAVNLPPTPTSTGKSTPPPNHTIHIYAAGMLSLVKQTFLANMPGAHKIAGASPENEKLLQDIDVAFIVGLEGIEAKISGIFKKMEEQ